MLVIFVAGTPPTRKSLASTFCTRSLKMMLMLARFVTVAPAVGVCFTINGATVLVGGIVMVTLTTEEVALRPWASMATAANPLLRKLAGQRKEYGGMGV